MSNKKHFFKSFLYFFCFLAIVVIVQFIGTLAMKASDPSWYQNLNKPIFSPPGYVFSIVWPILYLLIAISGFLIYRKMKSKYANLSLSLWFLQLVFNAIWTFLFFYLMMPFLGLIDIAIIWILTLLLIIYGFKVSKWASVLLMPYILWLTFAFIINLYLVLLNRSDMIVENFISY